MKIAGILFWTGVALFYSVAYAQQLYQVPVVPPMIALVTQEERDTVKQAFALLENTAQDLPERLKALQQWCREKRFYYMQKEQYLLLVSVRLLLAENPTHARAELLRLLASTLDERQPVSLHRLPSYLRSALLTTVERGKLLQLRGFSQVLHREAYLMLGARVVAEWTHPDGTQRRVEFNGFTPSPGRLTFSSHAPMPNEPQPSLGAVILYNTPASRTAYTQGLRLMSQFWQLLSEQGETLFREQERLVTERLTQLLEKEVGQKGIFEAPLAWSDLPLPYQERLRESLQRSGTPLPEVLQLSVRPTAFAFVRGIDSNFYQISWGLDDRVFPISFDSVLTKRDGE
ncbi:hypothetical protein GBSOP10_104715 [Armatimonadetes bacterium GBS]|jgi:hypothetical protein|nr:MAG: hypothetical protein KatS3mg021_0413 [Fimbriimonadales bacterium]CUU06656.1 hypothetical protein GBSOP10_104715 [Armatimonadetes bacterium GBS]CUU38198.1 hypothetical protein GXSOP10_13664 [Armatimonadetes bacterium GXS]